MGNTSTTQANQSDSSNRESPSDSPAPTDTQNPNSSPDSPHLNMSSSNDKQTPNSSSIDSEQTLESKSPNPETDDQAPESSIDTKVDKIQEVTATVSGNGEEIEGEGAVEEEEEGECGFCLWMKDGGCSDSFIAWDNCIKEAEKSKEDCVDKCVVETSAILECMQAHADYYKPLLRIDKERKEKKAAEEKEQQNVGTKDSEENGNAGGTLLGLPGK